MPSKPCPQCDERFTTREGFLEHIVVHSSIDFNSISLVFAFVLKLLLEIPGAKCLVEECDWTNPVPKDKSRLKQHMLSAHTESIPTARTAAAH